VIAPLYPTLAVVSEESAFIKLKAVKTMSLEVKTQSSSQKFQVATNSIRNMILSSQLTTQTLEENTNLTQQRLISNRYADATKQAKASTYPFKHFSIVSNLLLACVCAEIWTTSVLTAMKIDDRNLTSTSMASIAMVEEFVNITELFPRQTENGQIQNSLENNASMIPVVADNSKNGSQIEEDLKIAWLMSFPNSGTSYTTKLVRSVTQIQTASNYGFEHLKVRSEQSIRVYHDQANGPFYVDVDSKSHPERMYPSKFVLTKTHCGLRCEDCSPRKYLETTFSFRSRCSYGNWIELDRNGHPQLLFGSYPQTRVAKAVHLIRDPFDNIVSRFHLEQNERQKRKSRSLQYSYDRDGFRSYCKALHAKYVHEEMQYESLIDIFKNLTDVPCGTDFLRFTEWHNLAFATTRDMNLDTFILHYDDYETNFNQTTQGLMNFLELEAVADPYPFKLGKIYRLYFTAEEQGIVKRVVEWMSSPSTWKELERYFRH
jgi:Sulfotransferase domain